MLCARCDLLAETLICIEHDPQDKQACLDRLLMAGGRPLGYERTTMERFWMIMGMWSGIAKNLPDLDYLHDLNMHRTDPFLLNFNVKVHWNWSYLWESII